MDDLLQLKNLVRNLVIRGYTYEQITLLDWGNLNITQVLEEFGVEPNYDDYEKDNETILNEWFRCLDNEGLEKITRWKIAKHFNLNYNNFYVCCIKWWRQKNIEEKMSVYEDYIFAK